jgi:hypothetical protein
MLVQSKLCEVTVACSVDTGASTAASAVRLIGGRWSLAVLALATVLTQCETG